MCAPFHIITKRSSRYTAGNAVIAKSASPFTHHSVGTIAVMAFCTCSPPTDLRSTVRQASFPMSWTVRSCLAAARAFTTYSTAVCCDSTIGHSPLPLARCSHRTRLTSSTNDAFVFLKKSGNLSDVAWCTIQEHSEPFTSKIFEHFVWYCSAPAAVATARSVCLLSFRQ